MNDNFIFVGERFFAPDTCSAAINFFENNIDSAKAGTMGENETDPDRKECKEVFLNIQDIFREDPKFHRSFSKAVSSYVQRYPYMDKLWPWKVDDACKLQKYDPGECYWITHMENEGLPCSIRRMLTWMIYLNDVEVGGGTEWPEQKFLTKCRAGDIVIWPAHFTHRHHGLVAPLETKYILTGWFSFKETFDTDNRI